MDAPTQVTFATAAASREDASAISALLRQFFPFYCAIVALVTYGYALFDDFQLDGDAINYMDIGDNLRAHHWAGIVNGYWHPMYPAFLSLGHILFRATLATELHAYYMVNFFIFLLEMLAVITFTDALFRLRTTFSPPVAERALLPSLSPASYLLDRYALRYLGLALLVIASQRELSMAKVRPDALLQAFLLFALAALLNHLATARLHYAALMGLVLGCAYLTKSFAFVFAFLSILVLAAFRWIWLKHSLARVIPATLVAFLCFAVVAGPYAAALSRQHGRLDFGDSGSLNYAWYVGGTEKMHLQPYQTSQFGSADVHLKHPEKELLHSPLVLSYAEMAYGTYPDWFDTTYWNDQIKPHFRLRDDLPRVARNCVLVVRYLFNHPEALLLLALLLMFGARPTLGWKPGAANANAFWLAPLLLGVLIWGIYCLVNTEERYVTVAYISILITLFATLRIPNGEPSFRQTRVLGIRPLLTPIASALILLLGVLGVGESLRNVLESRRQSVLLDAPHAAQVRVAESLVSFGVHPGDAVACIGESACLNDYYWARLAQVRILTEIYDPDTPVPAFLDALRNRDQAIATVRAQGAVVLVADFANSRFTLTDPALEGWQQLDNTTFYALPFKN